MSRRLTAFLNDNKSDRGGIFTHTSLGSPYGSYMVHGVSYDHFLRLYCDALAEKNAKPLHLTERPSRFFPIIVDLDFRFSLEEGEHRRYDDDFVERFVELYTDEIYKVINTEGIETSAGPDDPVHAFVLTRPGPYVDETKKVLKDGIHLVFNTVHFNNTIQQLLREKVLARLQPFLTANLPGLLNKADDILDSHVTSNNWQMYGSCKPGRVPYIITRSLTMQPREGGGLETIEDRPVHEAEATDWIKHVQDFSVRRTHSRARTSPEMDDLANNAEYADFERQKEKLIRMAPHEMSMATRAVTFSDVADDDTLQAAIKFTEMLSADRAEAYDSWIRVGWALRNIDHRLQTAWNKFSAKSLKYEEHSCARLWNHMKREPHGLALGSLKRWAQMDNLEEFNAYAAESRRECVMDAMSGTHHDIARLVYSMYKDEFVCSELGSKTFYQFKSHKWMRLEHAHTLRARISTTVYNEIKKTMTRPADEAITTPEAAAITCEADNMKKTAAATAAEDTEASKRKENLRRVLDSLKDSNQKDKIMKECAELFYHRHFDHDLDEQTHLIGFTNGIYDLNAERFREGRPEDLVSMCTGIEYEVLDGDDVLEAEIDDFFCKVFPNPDMRKYAIGRFASFISGDVSREEFYIFTGSGSNGKSKTIELFEASFGDYCCKLPTSLLTQKRAAAGAASGELARTKSRRFCVLQEPGESERLNVGIMKELSGGDEIMCRALYCDPIQFKPQFNMVMTCNTLPEVPDNDGGTWRRIKVVEFGSKFVAEPKAKNEFEMDPELNAKFKRWKRPFMIMLIKQYVQDKGQKVIEPAQVSAITQRYREEQDHLAAFVKETFQRAEGCEISVKEVHACYKDWCKMNLAKSTKPDQMMSMVSKLKATDLKEPVGVKEVPLLRHVYKDWVFMED